MRSRQVGHGVSGDAVLYVDALVNTVMLNEPSKAWRWVNPEADPPIHDDINLNAVVT